MRFFLIIALLIISAPAIAQEKSNPFRSTAYPLPRFVTIASGEAYVRAGPGRKYPIQWVYKRAGLPVEIVLEFDHWRKIKDYDGEMGWVHKSLLSGKRNAIVQSNDTVSMFRKPQNDESLIALLEPNVIVTLEECSQSWCKVEVSGYKGWIEKENLWGVYAQEIIED